LRGRIDVAIYIDATPSVRFRRVERDVEEKRLSRVYAQAVYERFEQAVRRHLAPLRAAADVVLTGDESFHLTGCRPTPEWSASTIAPPTARAGKATSRPTSPPPPHHEPGLYAPEPGFG